MILTKTELKWDMALMVLNGLGFIILPHTPFKWLNFAACLALFFLIGYDNFVSQIARLEV